MSEATTQAGGASTETLYERAEHAARLIRARAGGEARVAVVLGSGLGAFADALEDAVPVPYSEIPGFLRPTVEGHAGRLVFGTVGGTAVWAMQGRFHFYEGHTLEEVTFPVRVLALAGVKSLVLTNAAGGVKETYEPGSLVCISDHLNLMGVSPLRGANDARFGPRFPDMSAVYDKEYRELVHAEAREMGLGLQDGVYAALSGPTYETPAEIRMMRKLGADAVGMSTVPEALVARHMGLRVLGLSCITNMAAGVLDQPINHEEVIETGERVRETFGELLRRVLPKLT
ncbi:MAG TPA: purine-nucleoside phosphorylase [Pyrinomonadaceae bacterium]|jgi:purine-nucleoside phosphorylase|nr:purine-nucleoside phosphorylase [Pyrinomonadaceae bacterium]